MSNYTTVLFVFQVPRNIFAEIGTNSDSSAASNLTTYTDFQVCGKTYSLGSEYFSQLSTTFKFASFIRPSVGTSVSVFRTDYCKPLMVLLDLLLALLHVVSLFSQTTVPVYWWWEGSNSSLCLLQPPCNCTINPACVYSRHMRVKQAGPDF